MRPRAALLAILLAAGGPAWAETLDFAGAWREALASDATLAAARAALEASRGYVPQARAGLLPNVQIAGSAARNQTENTSADMFGNPVTDDIDYTSQSHQLTLRQPLWRPANWAQYRLAHAQEAYAQAQYRKEWLGLVDRLARTYLESLLAEHVLELARTQKAAVAGQLEQAQRYLKAGEGTRTDIDEAQARLDMAVAREIEADNALEVARRSLQEIIGRFPGRLAPLRDGHPLALPEGPATPDAWVEQALERSPEIAAQQANVEAALRDADKARAGHHPTLDLLVGKSYSESDTNYSIGSTYDTNYVGIQYSVPIYAGGGVQAGIQIAEANLKKAREQRDAATRLLATEVRKAYANILSTVARINALKVAVRSAETALESTRRGFAAGVRTHVDILNALDQHHAAQRDYLSARHDYARHWLSLQMHAGSLDESGIEAFSRWFEPQPPAASAAN